LRGAGGGFGGVPDRGDETVAAAGDGLDESGGPGVVGEGVAEFRNAAGEDGLGDELATPHGLKDLFLGDDLAGAGGEEGEQVSELAAEVEAGAAPGDFVERRADEPFADEELGAGRGRPFGVHTGIMRRGAREACGPLLERSLAAPGLALSRAASQPG
jgi:hypothetical protein